MANQYFHHGTEDSECLQWQRDVPLHLQRQKPLELVGRLLYLNSQESLLEITSVSIFLIKSSSVCLLVIPNIVKP